MMYGAVQEVIVADGDISKPFLRITTNHGDGKKYRRTFTGSNLIDVLLSRFNLPGGAGFRLIPSPNYFFNPHPCITLYPKVKAIFNIPTLSTPDCSGRAEAIQVATMLLKVQLFTHQTVETPRKGPNVQFVDSHYAFYQLRVSTGLYDRKTN